MMSTEFMKEFRHGIHELHNTHSTTRTTRTFKHSIPITSPQESWAIVFFSEFVGSQSSQRRSPICITHHKHVWYLLNCFHAHMKLFGHLRHGRLAVSVKFLQVNESSSSLSFVFGSKQEESIFWRIHPWSTVIS